MKKFSHVVVILQKWDSPPSHQHWFECQGWWYHMHAHWEVMKRFNIPLISLSGESRTGSRADMKMAWESRKWRLAWDFIVVRGLEWGVRYMWELKLLLFELSAEEKEGITWSLLSACPDVGQKGKERNDSWKLSTMKYGVRNFFIPCFTLHLQVDFSKEDCILFGYISKTKLLLKKKKYKGNEGAQSVNVGTTGTTSSVSYYFDL